MFTFWQISTFGTLMLYSIFFDFRIMWIWLIFLAAYIGLGFVVSGPENNSTRRKIRMATWTPATEPNCYVKIEVDLENADKFIQQKEAQGHKVTYTAIALKAIGNSYANNKKEHGKIIFNR